MCTHEPESRALEHPAFQAARPYLISALERSTDGLTLFDVAAELDANRAILWSGERSAMVTVVDDTGMLTVWLGGGDLRELLDKGMPRAVRWATDAGCVACRILGRRGWDRVLRKHGWRRVNDEELVKEL